MELLNCRDVFKDDPKVIYIGRPGPFGNPFRMRNEEDRRDVVDNYKIWFDRKIISDFQFRRSILALRGFNLSCWCPPEPCHGDVIIEWLGRHKEKK